MCLKILCYFIHSSSYGASWNRNTCHLLNCILSTSSCWMSLTAGMIISSPLVKGFLALTLLLAAKNDALSADTFDEVVAFNNCFCFSCSCFFFWKTPKAYLLMKRGQSSWGEAVLKVSWLCWIASCHILYKASLENMNHLLRWTHNLSRTLYFLLNTAFLLLAVLESSAAASLLFFKEALQRHLFFYSFWLGLACGLTKTVTETSVQCVKEAQMELVNKIIGRPQKY